MSRLNKFKGSKKENHKSTFMNGQNNKLTMLSAIQDILVTTEDSSLSFEALETLKPNFEYIADLQGITTSQALLLSLFVEECSDGSNATISDIARFLNCTKVRIMQFQEDIDDLVKRKFLRKVQRRYGDSIGYRVSEDVISAIKSDKRFTPKPLKAKDGIQFFQMFYDLTHQRSQEEIDTDLMKEEFLQLLDENESVRYVQRLKTFALPLNSQLIVTHIARFLVLNQRDYATDENLNNLFDNVHEAFNELHSLAEGQHILMKKHLVEYDDKEEFLNNSKFKLTDTAKKKLLKEFSLPKKKVDDVEAIKADSIVPKSLFFNDRTKQQMDELSELLSVEKLTTIQTRLKNLGRRTGFACLFYGAPGTGKTESVLQIAHKTGRDIMIVDMSEIKSKWVGESEQNIKAVFNNYRAFCEACDRTPILLFNEADAILGTRMGRAVESVDKMNNAIQNIVLQEMESLEGIMIATTNLEQNLDNAFERRFIYKVRFDRPNVEQRKNIWLSMMPSLTSDMALQLASTFDLSGGQIENIVRKCDVECILHDESAVDADKIQRFCKEETILKQKVSRIGF